MNWKSKLAQILGKFWTTIYDDSSFVEGILRALTLCSKNAKAVCDKITGIWAPNEESHNTSFPFIIYLDIKSMHKETVTYEEYLSGTAIGTTKENPGWVIDSLGDISNPSMLTNSIDNIAVTLIDQLDYTYKEGKFLFNVAPDTLGLSTVLITDAAGVLNKYYILFGYKLNKTYEYTSDFAFLHKELSLGSAWARDIHTNGATLYNTKQLLASVTGSVIAEDGGNIDDVWKEQGTWHLLLNSKVYSSVLTPNVSHGDTVSKGCVLFGNLAMYDGYDTPAFTDIPGIRVNTDAGSLVAKNTEEDAIDNDGVLILPLEGDASTVAKYRQICTDNTKDDKCPTADIPASVNPYLFIMNKIRKGRGYSIKVHSTKLSALGAALAFLRKRVCASGIINVYIQANTTTGQLSMSNFTATAGTAAVAVVAPLHIREQLTSTKVIT